MPSDRKRYRLLVIAGPLAAPFMMIAQHMHAPDFAVGLIAGAGIGLAIVGLIGLRRPAC